MSKKKSRRKPESELDLAPSLSVEALKKRRNRRLIFVGLIGLSFPILEAIAYRFRAITITVDNRSDGPINGLKVTYSGGSFEAPELKSGGSITRLTRPDFTFSGNEFSTYRLTIQFSTADGGVFRQIGRAGALDFSAHEKYIVEPAPPGLPIELKHTTSPGFPMSAIRELLARMGLG